jgi:hypothetical protein
LIFARGYSKPTVSTRTSSSGKNEGEARKNKAVAIKVRRKEIELMFVYPAAAKSTASLFDGNFVAEAPKSYPSIQ